MAMAVAAPEPPLPMSYATRRPRQRCSGHQWFATAMDAWDDYLAKLLANRADPGQTVFRCGLCGFFHHGGSGFKSLGRLLDENGWTDEKAH